MAPIKMEEKKHHRNIIIMGPQGSGKSTQAILLAQKLGLKHISTGRTLREMAKENSLLGKRLAKFLAAGLLIPHREMMAVIERVVPRQGFVLEGSPRELRQAKALTRRIDKVIYVHIPDEEGARRILKGTKIGGKGVARRGRSDDTPQAIKKRLALFHQRTEPVLNFYRKKGLLVEVDGMGTIDEVFGRVKKAVGG